MRIRTIRSDSIRDKIKIEVIDLLKNSKLSHSEIGKKFGLSRGPIYMIQKEENIVRENIRKKFISCKFCGKEARYINSKTRPNRFKYCSKECYRQWQMSDDNRGSNNPAWKGGWEKLKWVFDSAEWKEWRKFIYERDDYTCQECNKRGGKLHPHHILYRSDFPELIFDKNNGITLCASCHTTIHKYKDKKLFYREKFQLKIASLFHS